MVVRVSQPAFNLRSRLNELDGTVPHEKMPIGSTWLLKHTTSSTRTNVSNNGSWTSLSGLSIDVQPKFRNSKLWIEFNFTMEMYDRINGLAFKIVRESPIGSNSTKVYEHDQHSHWDPSRDWTGPGTIYLTVMDEPNYPIGQKVKYYVQCKKQSGNDLYSNYGQDESGIQNTVWEIKQ